MQKITPKCWCCGATQKAPLKSLPNYQTMSSAAICNDCFKQALSGLTLDQIKARAA